MKHQKHFYKGAIKKLEIRKLHDPTQCFKRISLVVWRINYGGKSGSLRASWKSVPGVLKGEDGWDWRDDD